MEEQTAVGRIEVIMGPMFAGKTSALLLRVAELEAQGLRVALVKSDKDARYHATAVVTHDGAQRCAHALPRLADLRARLGPAAYADCQVVAIDEAQFFGDLRAFCVGAAEREGKTVLLAGLDGDFRRNLFGQVLQLVPLADRVTKLAARCAYCAAPAHFSLRIAADERQEVVGGADTYAPVCRTHYVRLSRVRGSAER